MYSSDTFYYDDYSSVESSESILYLFFARPDHLYLPNVLPSTLSRETLVRNFDAIVQKLSLGQIHVLDANVFVLIDRFTDSRSDLVLSDLLQNVRALKSKYSKIIMFAPTLVDNYILENQWIQQFIMNDIDVHLV
ncbi:hypothetical protein HT594_00025 [Phenacoccus solenopsis nudivirus]|nr:hypothetical protein HT594_00025 [Phenacoccus solenopsis nudivirus]